MPKAPVGSLSPALSQSYASPSAITGSHPLPRPRPTMSRRLADAGCIWWPLRPMPGGPIRIPTENRLDQPRLPAKVCNQPLADRQTHPTIFSVHSAAAAFAAGTMTRAAATTGTAYATSTAPRTRTSARATATLAEAAGGSRAACSASHCPGCTVAGVKAA